MTVSWYETDLSTAPPSVQVGPSDTRNVTVAAGEAVTAATAVLLALGSGESVGTGIAGGAVAGSITAMSLASDIASVRVTGLTLGVVYVLAVTFTAGTDLFTNTVVVECVL